MISIADIIGGLKHTELIERVGQHTLSILIWHFLAFKVVTIIQLLIYKEPIYRIASFPVFISSDGWWILYTIVGVIVPVSIACLYSKTKKACIRMREERI